jgi:hypothetical protein
LAKGIQFDEGETSIKRVVRREIKMEECLNDSAEVVILGGEQSVPVLEWDYKKIRDSIGPAAKLF